MKVLMAAWYIEFALVLQDSWERKEVKKWNGVMRELRRAACVVGRAREVCSQYVTKVMFAVGGNKLWSHHEFVFLVVLGRSMDVSRKCCPGVKLSLGAGVEFDIAIDLANFECDVKLFLCLAYWSYLIHIQLGSLGLREIDTRIHKLDRFPHCVHAAAI